ncbi:MAG: serine/threonine-protein kinase [Verrucomicrobiota bacterium]
MTSNPASPPVCVECGAALSPYTSEGLCTRCLLQSGVQILSELDVPQTTTYSGQTLAAFAQVTIRQASSGSRRLDDFGDYQLLDEIGRGGMGVVFRARQVSLNRIVAVKMLKFGAFTREEYVARFRKEAEAAATLRHPNIVAIHDSGECAGEHYYSMEFIEGKSLADWSGGQPLEPRRAAGLMCPIASAVQHAHSRGILHRDLKPSNILLDQEDQPHVSDFGLARRMDENSSLTMSGQAFGSPNYMAPEQAAGERGRVSVRSDLWSLGAVLYYLLTARPPFAGPTIAETIRALHDDEPARPRLLNSSIPTDLETICLKCLEKEPGKRYCSAQDFAEDLGRFLRHEPISARPIARVERAWRWCRRKPALAGALGTAGVLLLSLLIGSPIAVYRVSHERSRAEKGEFAARQKAYASDMNRAQQAIQADEFDLALRLLDAHRPTGKPLRGSQREKTPIDKSVIPQPQPATDLRGWEWRYLWRQCQGEQRFILDAHTKGLTAVGLLRADQTAFSAGRDRSVRLWDLKSRRQVGLLPHADEVIGAAASPDGRWLAIATEKEAESRPILLWDLAAQKVAAEFNTVTAKSTNFWLRTGSIVFSPDSKWLAFATMWGGVRIWDVNARVEIANLPATNSFNNLLGLAFSPDSHTLAYNENDDGTIVLWDINARSTRRLTGRQSAITSLTFSPDGQLLASASEDGTARLWELAHAKERFGFTNHSGGLSSLSFSPDGRTLASGGEGSGQVIRLINVETGQLKAELRGHLKEVSALVLTRDGQTLLSSSGDGTLRAWDPAVPRKQTLSHVFAPNSISVAWANYGPALFLSADGRHLLTVYSNQTFSVWDTLRLAEGERHSLPFTNTAMAAVAPGGRLASFGSRNGEIVLWDVETGNPRPLPQAGMGRIHRLTFSPDGRYLAAADDFKLPTEMAGSNDDPRRTVRVWDLNGREKIRVFSPDGQFLWKLSFSQDSKMLMGGTWRGDVMLWLLKASRGPSTFLERSGNVEGLASLPDGETLLSASTDIHFWSIRTRHETGTLRPRIGWFSSLALSPDGRRLAAGVNNGRIMIWDLASREEVAMLEGHKETVTQIAFTDDGDHLISVSKDQLRVWRGATLAETETDGTGEKR